MLRGPQIRVALALSLVYQKRFRVWIHIIGGGLHSLYLYWYGSIPVYLGVVENYKDSIVIQDVCCLSIFNSCEYTAEPLTWDCSFPGLQEVSKATTDTLVEMGPLFEGDMTPLGGYTIHTSCSRESLNHISRDFLSSRLPKISSRSKPCSINI